MKFSHFEFDQIVGGFAGSERAVRTTAATVCCDKGDLQQEVLPGLLQRHRLLFLLLSPPQNCGQVSLPLHRAHQNVALPSPTAHKLFLEVRRRLSRVLSFDVRAEASHYVLQQRVLLSDSEPLGGNSPKLIL